MNLLKIKELTFCIPKNELQNEPQNHLSNPRSMPKLATYSFLNGFAAFYSIAASPRPNHGPRTIRLWPMTCLDFECRASKDLTPGRNDEKGNISTRIQQSNCPSSRLVPSGQSGQGSGYRVKCDSDKLYALMLQA